MTCMDVWPHQPQLEERTHGITTPAPPLHRGTTLAVPCMRFSPYNSRHYATADIDLPELPQAAGVSRLRPSGGC
jgi:hypothetical protein